MPKTILAVDDSASVRQVVAFTLRGGGYEVIEAVDGMDALRRLTRAVDMVITDLNMPNFDGIQLIKAIRAMQEYRCTPIVMLTTESQDSRKQAGKAAGATGWMVKPFRPDQLLTVVKKVIG